MTRKTWDTFDMLLNSRPATGPVTVGDRGLARRGFGAGLDLGGGSMVP